MGIQDRDWYRGEHPSACNCVDCVEERRRQQLLETLNFPEQWEKRSGGLLPRPRCSDAPQKSPEGNRWFRRLPWRIVAIALIVATVLFILVARLVYNS